MRGAQCIKGETLSLTQLLRVAFSADYVCVSPKHHTVVIPQRIKVSPEWFKRDFHRKEWIIKRKVSNTSLQ